jgi:hypothetical protein
VILEHGQLDTGRRYAVVEELSTFCPLGLRFWDAVTDDQVRDGLLVRAWPVPARRPIVRAFRTVSGIYAFQGLPGLREIEEPPATLPAASPPVTRPFIVEARDPERRFLPIAFRVDLPLMQRGLFMPPMVSSPSPGAGGFYLFSSPVRQRPPGIAVVRAELVDLLGRPVPWAMVRVSIAGQGDRWGLADEAGRVAVQFPLPLLTPFGELFGSPPGAVSPPGPPVGDRTWDVTVAVFSEPTRLAPLPGTALPDLAEVFQQAAAGVITADGSPPVAAVDWPGTLGWDGELFAATQGHRQLWVVSQGSP